jgi:DNA-binding response OmpR family regulator
MATQRPLLGTCKLATRGRGNVCRFRQKAWQDTSECASGRIRPALHATARTFAWRPLDGVCMPKSLNPGTVLVVDDDEELRELVAQCLTAEGYEPLLAADGREALAAIQEQPAPDVVVLDLLMPNVDGYAVLEHLTERGMSELPVLVLSGRVPDSRLFAALSVGPRDFIAKPFELEELVLRLQRLRAGTAGHPADRGLMRVYTLGSLRVHRNDLLLFDESWHNRPAKSVFKLLFTRRGERLPAEMIAELLWPGVSSDSAANRVRVAVHGLRKRLGYSASRGTGDSPIGQQDGLYVFDRTVPYWCDCSCLDEILQRGNRATQEGDVMGALRAYAEADILYGGDYFRDDPYAEWLVAERERLREAHMAMLAEMARLHSVAGDDGEAVRLCRRMLGTEPWREEVYRHLMRSLYALGRPNEALRAFEQCRRSMENKLGIEPAAETVRLRDQIAAGDA